MYKEEQDWRVGQPCSCCCVDEEGRLDIKSETSGWTYVRKDEGICRSNQGHMTGTVGTRMRKIAVQASVH